MDNEQIAENIKTKCKEKNISISFLLRSCSVHSGFLYDLEKRDKTPKIDTLVKIADFLDCSLDYLAGRSQ